MLREYRDKAQGLPDLLQYALLVDEGIVLNKDGSFSAGFRYRGPDLASESPGECEALVARVNATFCQLGDGWMLHADRVRKESCAYPSLSHCHFPDATSALIDAERRQQYSQEGAHFESHYYFVLTYLTPTARQSQWQRLFLKGALKTQPNFEKTLLFFQEKMAALENSLSNNVRIERLTSETLLTHLHTCITGLHHPLSLPHLPVYCDTLLSSKDLLGGMAPKIGAHYMVLVSVTGLPLASDPAY